MSATTERGHILTVTRVEDFDPDYPSFNYSVECLAPDRCDGWSECDQEHEHDGRSAADGPWECEEGSHWADEEEYEFHGIVHTWRECHGWTVPFLGCVVAENEHLDSDAHDIALDHGCGRHEVRDDWDDEDCTLIHVRALDDGDRDD